MPGLRSLPDPAYDGQSENDVDGGGDAPSEGAQLRAMLETPQRHTGTPDDCYFCLWDGWSSDICGGGARIVDWQTVWRAGSITTGAGQPRWRCLPLPSRRTLTPRRGTESTRVRYDDLRAGQHRRREGGR
jgi:hypothetical protein